jgi:hypothetical protein
MTFHTRWPLSALCAALSALLILALPQAATSQTPTGRMPTLVAEDLNERPVTLPADLPADKTLVLMGFAIGQQQVLNTWIDGLKLAGSQLPWIETPVVEDRNAFRRGLVNGGMRMGIRDTAVRERTITLFTDPAALRREMGLPGDGKVVLVLVLDRSGQVLGFEQGPYSAEKAQPLLALLTPK